MHRLMSYFYAVKHEVTGSPYRSYVAAFVKNPLYVFGHHEWVYEKKKKKEA